MNLRAFALVIFALLFSHPAAMAAIVGAPTQESVAAQWNLAGDWLTKQPAWTDIITIKSDGTFKRSGGDHGKWRLNIKDNPPTLELQWARWKTQSVTFVTRDLLRGNNSPGLIELKRVTPAEAAAFLEKSRPAKEFDDPALKASLKDSTWQLKDGKTFTLHGDGSTTGSWHDTKGFWRIVGPGKVQLTIKWRPEAPSIVSVESDNSILRWGDEEWSMIARRVSPK